MVTDYYIPFLPAPTSPLPFLDPRPVVPRHSPPEIVIRGSWIPDELRHRIRQWTPRSDLGRIAKECLRFLPAEQAAELLDSITRSTVIESSLRLVARRLNEVTGLWMIEDYGVVGRKVVTTAGVNYIAQVYTGSGSLANFKYHGIGTGTTAEATGDTALVTELTTEYNPNSTRATGTTTAPGSSNILETVGTNTLDSGTPAITEHGVFSASSTGTLLDRTKFAAINLVGANGDSLQSTYDLTLSAGG